MRTLAEKEGRQLQALVDEALAMGKILYDGGPQGAFGQAHGDAYD